VKPLGDPRSIPSKKRPTVFKMKGWCNNILSNSKFDADVEHCCARETKKCHNRPAHF
jgi:hypothetical protein